MTTRIFVSVGTDHHPFTRLIDWVDDWVADHGDVELIVQHGATRPSRHGTNHELLGGQEIIAQYAAATLVVSQVGPGTIADANRAGHRPIVVPRDPALGEVVDDHQVAFGDFMTARGRCVSVRSRDDLVAQLEARLAAPTSPPLPSDALAAGTTAAVADLARTVLSAPRRRFTVRRLLAAARPPTPSPGTPTPRHPDPFQPPIRAASMPQSPEPTPPFTARRSI